MIRLNAGTQACWRVMVAGCSQPRARRGALKPTPAGSQPPQPQGPAGVLTRLMELSPRQMLCVLHELSCAGARAEAVSSAGAPRGSCVGLPCLGSQERKWNLLGTDQLSFLTPSGVLDLQSGCQGPEGQGAPRPSPALIPRALWGHRSGEARAYPCEQQPLGCCGGHT